jgi:predicted Fe-Mo cluster-binding NifX family protein
MSKVGFTTLLNREDSVLSPHFGMAKWVMILDDDSGAVTFERNTGLSGRAVVDILARAGCRDAVFSEIGNGALRHLEDAGIRGWLASVDVPVSQLRERLSRGELASAEGHTHGSGGDGHHECCGAGHGGRERCGTGHSGEGSAERGSTTSGRCCERNRHGAGHQQGCCASRT